MPFFAMDKLSRECFTFNQIKGWPSISQALVQRCNPLGPPSLLHWKILYPPFESFFRFQLIPCKTPSAPIQQHALRGYVPRGCLLPSSKLETAPDCSDPILPIALPSVQYRLMFPNISLRQLLSYFYFYIIHICLLRVTLGPCVSPGSNHYRSGHNRIVSRRFNQ